MRDYEKLITWESIDSALQNALRIYNAGLNIGNGGNFGLGTSLMVLSREEAQKSLLMAFVKSGLYDLRNPEIVMELDDCFLRHRYKIASSWLVNAFVTYVIANVEAWSMQTRPSPATQQDIQRVIQSRVENLHKLAKQGTPFLDNLKVMGLYVGPNMKGEWSNPTNISHEVFSQLEGSTSFHILVVRLAIALLRSQNIPEDWKRAAQEFRRLISEKPSDPMVLKPLEEAGQLGSILAGFWRFLQASDLLDAHQGAYKLPKPKKKR